MNSWFSRHGQQVRQGELAQHDDPLYHKKGFDTPGQNYIFHKREAESAAGGRAWIFSVSLILFELRKGLHKTARENQRDGFFVRWQWMLGVLELLICWYHRERVHPTGQKLHFVTTHWLKTLQHPLHISVFWLSNVNYLRKQAKFNSLYKLMPTKGKLFDQKKNMYVIYITINLAGVLFCWGKNHKKPMRSLARHRSLGGLV